MCFLTSLTPFPQCLQQILAVTISTEHQGFIAKTCMHLETGVPQKLNKMRQRIETDCLNSQRARPGTVFRDQAQSCGQDAGRGKFQKMTWQWLRRDCFILLIHAHEQEIHWGTTTSKARITTAEAGGEQPEHHSACFHWRASEYQNSHSISQHPWSFWPDSTFLLTGLKLSPTQGVKSLNWKNYQITSLSLGNFLYIWIISLKRPDRMY